MGKDKKSTTSQTQSQTSSSGLDAASQAYVNQMRGTGNQAAAAAQGYQTQGLTPQQIAAMQQMGSPLTGIDFSQYMQQINAPQVGQQNLGLGGVTPQSVSGAVTPQQVQAQQVGGLPQLTAQQVQAQQVGGPQAYDPASAQAFMDPYEQQVISGVQSDFDRQRDAALTSGAQQATMAGAFGGSRSGILQSQALDNVNRNESQALAQLRSGGFQNAQQQAQAQHAMQQQLGMQAGLANQGAGMQSQLANQAAGLQAGGVNLSAAQQAQMANQSAGLQAQLANQGAGMNAAQLGLQGQLANQGAGLQAAGLNQQGMLAQGQLNQQGELANQAAAMQAAGMNAQQNLGFGGLAAQQNQNLQQMGMSQAGQLFGMGEQQRMLQQQQSMDPYTQQMMALQARQQALGPYGQTSTSTGKSNSTNVESGSLVGDLMGVGTMVAGFATGNPGMAAAAGQAYQGSQAGGGMPSAANNYGGFLPPMPSFNMPQFNPLSQSGYQPANSSQFNLGFGGY